MGGAADSPGAVGSPGGPEVAGGIVGVDEHALFMLQQKEAALQEMRDYTAQLQSRLDAVVDEQKDSVNQAEQEALGARTAAANEDYRDRYMRARGEYRRLLRSRVGAMKSSSAAAQARARDVAHPRMAFNVSLA